MTPSPNIKKILLIVILLMTVIGFTLPGFFNLDEQPLPQEEQRLCQYDQDCSLLCDGRTVKILCLQNLCQQNSCTDRVVFPYQEEPLRFSLAIEISNGPLQMQNRSDSGDYFVQFSEDTVQVFTPYLSLQQILEKAALKLTDRCLEGDGSSWCTSPLQELSIFVNGNKSYQAEQYVPKEGDVIEIHYLPVEARVEG